MSILDFNGAAWGIPAGGLHSASYCPPIVPAPAGTEPNPPADPLRRHNQVIPEAAVEAAAKAEYEHEFLALEGTWADASKEVRALFRLSARAALEAAAPHMLAAAWEAGESAGYCQGREWPDMRTVKNPYR